MGNELGGLKHADRVSEMTYLFLFLAGLHAILLLSSWHMYKATRNKAGAKQELVKKYPKAFVFVRAISPFLVACFLFMLVALGFLSIKSMS